MAFDGTSFERPVNLADIERHRAEDAASAENTKRAGLKDQFSDARNKIVGGTTSLAVSLPIKAAASMLPKEDQEISAPLAMVGQAVGTAFSLATTGAGALKIAGRLAQLKGSTTLGDAAPEDKGPSLLSGGPS
ncbi:MAG: hypothetical protein AAF244_02180 [Pseudomonadota bacterium]